MTDHETQTLLDFDEALTVGQHIEAHWTNCGRRYVAPATVTKVNAKSVLVALGADVREALYGETEGASDDGIVYPAGHTITLPRLGNAKNYSANNGAYSMPDTSMSVGEAQDEAWMSVAVPAEPYDSATQSLAVIDDADLPPELQAPLLPATLPVIAYTTAPEDYDGFGTVTLEVMGTLTGYDGNIHDAHVSTYRKIAMESKHARWQMQRNGSGFYNTHTPAEFAELLDQSWFQKRFVPMGCEPERDTENVTVESETLNDGAYAIPRDLIRLTSPIRDYRALPVPDTAPVPRFDPDDGAWLESLDAILCPDVSAVAHTWQTCVACDQGRLSGTQRFCGDCVAALEAGTADTVTQLLALAVRGREAVARAVATGQVRWGTCDVVTGS